MQQIIAYFSKHPKKLFLTDSMGALLTAGILGLILLFFRALIGIDSEMATTLLFIALIYAAYSFCCYIFQPKNWRNFLKVIAIANILYTGIIMLFIIQSWKSLTLIGIAYFIIESIIILSLAILELQVIGKSKKISHF